MALFVDGPPSGMDDLAAHDSQLFGVAAIEGIDLTQKLGLAYEEVGMQIESLLGRAGSTRQSIHAGAESPLAAVVVTQPVKLWHLYRTLEMVYSDAYNSQLNDRYAGKRNQFGEQRRWAHERVLETGIGIASQPVPQAKAPVMAAAPGALDDNVYYAAMSWLNDGGEEGAVSLPASLSTSASGFTVRAGAAPRGATGWNVYVGADPAALSRQNATRLATAAVWAQPGLLISGGRAPSAGQAPTHLRPVGRFLQRG